MRFWRNTPVAHLGRRPDRRRSATASLGYEWDEDADNGFRPAGLIRLSTTNASTRDQVLQDYGNNYGPGTRHPPPDAVPGAQRGAGLRRRHGPVVLGPGRQPRPRTGAASDVADAAGDRQPARRHGRPAGDPAGRPDRRDRSRPTRAAHDLDDHLAGRRRDRAGRRSRHDQRHRQPTPAAGRSAASRSRPTAAPPGTRRPAAATWTLHLDAHGYRADRRSRPGPPTTAADIETPAPASP